MNINNGIDIPDGFIDVTAYLIAKYSLRESQEAREGKNPQGQDKQAG